MHISYFLTNLLPSLHLPYVYVSAQKTACTTVKVLLWQAEFATHQRCAFFDKHWTGLVHGKQNKEGSPWLGYRFQPDYLSKLRERLSTPSFTFALVRNPYHRALSVYLGAFGDGFAPVPAQATFRKRIGWPHTTNPSFQEFLTCLRDQPASARDIHWESHSNLLMLDPVGYDYLGAVETLQSDLKVIFRRIFGHHQFDDRLRLSSADASSKVEKYYNKECLRLVRTIYADDFENFGYRKRVTNIHPDRRILDSRAAGGGIPVELVPTDLTQLKPARPARPAPPLHRPTRLQRSLKKVKRLLRFG